MIGIILLLIVVFLLIEDNKYFQDFELDNYPVLKNFACQAVEGFEILKQSLVVEVYPKPTMWIYYKTDEINSRHWQDFGSRNSRSLNMPFLNLCYASISHHNNDKYNIVPVMGIEEMANIMGGWDNMPLTLRKNPDKYIEERELTWIMTAILSRHGGLWVSPYTICMRPFDKKPLLTFYGKDDTETYAGKNGTFIPGFHCIWSPSPENGFIVEWEKICRRRVEENDGGQLIRADIKWDWINLSHKYNYNISPHSEGSRKRDGTRICIEDILSVSIDPDWIDSDTIYVPIYYKELRMFRNLLWFLRMSEEQIMISNTTIKKLLDISLL